MGQSTPSTEIRQIELPSHFRKRFFQTICQIICIRNEKLKDKERQQSNATYHSWLQFRNCRHKKPNPLAVGFGINSTNHSSQDFLSAIALNEQTCPQKMLWMGFSQILRLRWVDQIPHFRTHIVRRTDERCTNFFVESFCRLVGVSCVLPKEFVCMLSNQLRRHHWEVHFALGEYLAKQTDARWHHMTITMMIEDGTYK
jgi:hypothetical protein